MTLEERARVLSNWRSARQENLTLVPVPPEAFDLAALCCDLHELGLRAGDALHVAVAALGGHRLATLGGAMAKAAVAVGVQVEWFN